MIVIVFDSEAIASDGLHKLVGKVARNGDLLFVLEHVSSGHQCADVRIQADGSAVSLHDPAQP